MKIVTTKKVLGTITKTFLAVNTEGVLNIGPDGIRVKMVDPSHVAMLSMNIEKGAFGTYEVKAEEKFALNMKKIDKVIALADDGEIIMEHNPDKNQMVISFGSIVREFPLMNADIFSEPKEPEFKTPVEISIEAKDLKLLKKMCKDVNDYVEIEIDGENVILGCVGDLGSGKMTFTHEEVGLVNAVPCKASYALDWFGILTAALDGKIVLRLGDNLPFRMKAELFDGNGEVTYLLAPRIKED